MRRAQRSHNNRNYQQRYQEAYEEERIRASLERSIRRRRARLASLGMLAPESTNESNQDAPAPAPRTTRAVSESTEMALNAIFNVVIDPLANALGEPRHEDMEGLEGLAADPPMGPGTSQNVRQQQDEVIEILNSPPNVGAAVRAPESSTSTATSTSTQESAQNASVNMPAASSTVSEDNLSTPSPPKKRKRNAGEIPRPHNTPRLKDVLSDDEENDPESGLTCPICFDNWEMSGEHRLVSLRCGHLFGETCIRRWLAECARQSGVKMCPQCKTKATPRDIRHLFAKRVRAVDRTEEHELRKCLEQDRKKLKNVEIELDTLKITHAVAVKKIHEQELEIERLRNSIRLRSNILLSDDLEGSSKVYKLFMEQSVQLPRDGACRVMAYTKKHSALLVSQKSMNTLFPGFGVRFIDVPSFRAMQFKHLASKMLRDIAISSDEQLLACTSLEPTVKLYDLRTRTTSALMAPNSTKKLWACALGDAGRESYLYSGGQQGSIFVFDTRSPNEVLAEYGDSSGDFSPVINIAVVPKSDEFPFGGFCICQLQSIWFYEYNAEDKVTQTRLNIEGPFISMNYDAGQSLLIVTVRTASAEQQSRYLVGQLTKIEQRPHFELTTTLIGSSVTPVMMRSSYVSIDSSFLFTSYMQDTKQLALFDVRRKCKIQSLPINDLVYDTCPIYTSQGTYVAALSETKCRIYKLNES